MHTNKQSTPSLQVYSILNFLFVLLGHLVIQLINTKSLYNTYIIIQTLSIDLSRTSELWLWYSFDFFLIETYVPLKKLVATLFRISLYIESNQSFWGLLSKFLTPLTNSYFLLSHGPSETCVLSGPKVPCFRGSSILIEDVSALIIMLKLTAISGIIPVEEYLIIVVHIVEKLLLFGVNKRTHQP